MGIHETEPQTKTITSSLECSPPQQRTQAKVDQAKRQAIVAALVKLGSHYHRADFGPEQVKHMAMDFIEDLGGFTIGDIENACRDYRTNAKNKFFPTPGQLLECARANQKHREELAKLGPSLKDAESRPLRWWEQRRRFWKPHWTEDEIPEHERKTYFKLKEMGKLLN